MQYPQYCKAYDANIIFWTCNQHGVLSYVKFAAQPTNLRKTNARCKLRTIWQSSMKNASSHLDPAQKPVVSIGLVCVKTCLNLRFQEAEKLHTEVCKKMEAQFGTEHGDVTSSKFNLVPW